MIKLHKLLKIFGRMITTCYLKLASTRITNPTPGLRTTFRLCLLVNLIDAWAATCSSWLVESSCKCSCNILNSWTQHVKRSESKFNGNGHSYLSRWCFLNSLAGQRPHHEILVSLRFACRQPATYCTLKQERQCLDSLRFLTVERTSPFCRFT